MDNKDVINPRIDYLDSMRGIAACMVVVYHFIGWHWPDYTRFHVASLIFNGSDAVSFFFVLSGFVLSFKYFQKDIKINLAQYTLKRIFRLYPAYIIAVVTNYLYWNSEVLLRGEYFVLIRDVLLNKQNLWDELIMVRGNHKFYIPGWTLGVEMALSMIMPLIIATGKSNIKILWWFLPVSIFMGSYISMFSFHFILGSLLAYYYPYLSSFQWKNTIFFKYRYLILFGSFLLFSIRHLEKISNFGPGYYMVSNFLKIDFFHYTGLASALILIWVISSPFIQNILTKPFLIFIGKISFGIYLFHWLYVGCVMERWESLIVRFPNYNLGFVVLLFVTLILTGITATVTYYLVEKPFIKISQNFFK